MSLSPDARIWSAKTDIQKVAFEGGSPGELDAAFKEIRTALLDERPIQHVGSAIDALRLLSSLRNDRVVNDLMEVLKRHQNDQAPQTEMKNELKSLLQRAGLV